jgi:hypothetical protein
MSSIDRAPCITIVPRTKTIVERRPAKVSKIPITAIAINHCHWGGATSEVFMETADTDKNNPSRVGRIESEPKLARR